ncbi:hypothetical protein [Metallosphaera sp.]|uniref:hypothetical protein n=1 Tax=Metallosphaera sp. TaxID=2020860 RepID=UPI0031681374
MATIQLLKDGITTLYTAENPKYTAQISGVLHVVFSPQNSTQLGLRLNQTRAWLFQGNTLSPNTWYDADGLEVLANDEISLYVSNNTQAYVRLYIKAYCV